MFEKLKKKSFPRIYMTEIPLDCIVPSAEKIIFQCVRTGEFFSPDEISFSQALSDDFKVFYFVEVENG